MTKDDHSRTTEWTYHTGSGRRSRLIAWFAVAVLLLVLCGAAVLTSDLSTSPGNVAKDVTSRKATTVDTVSDDYGRGLLAHDGRRERQRQLLATLNPYVKIVKPEKRSIEIVVPSKKKNRKKIKWLHVVVQAKGRGKKLETRRLKELELFVNGKRKKFYRSPANVGNGASSGGPYSIRKKFVINMEPYYRHLLKDGDKRSRILKVYARATPLLSSNKAEKRSLAGRSKTFSFRLVQKNLILERRISAKCGIAPDLDEVPGRVRVDLMAVYTGRAMCGHAHMPFPCSGVGSPGTAIRSAIEAEILLDVEATNVAFFHSGIGVFLNLVYLDLDAFSLAFPEETNQSDRSQAQYDQMLDRLMNREDISSLRNTYGADVVALFVDKRFVDDNDPTNANSASGSEFGNPSQAYVVVSRNARHQFEFAHAIGRIFGARPENSFCNPISGGSHPCFKTIMAARTSEECECLSFRVRNGIRAHVADSGIVPRVPWFSNSQVEYSGVSLRSQFSPTCDPAATVCMDSADVINANADTVASYRPEQAERVPDPALEAALVGLRSLCGDGGGFVANLPGGSAIEAVDFMVLYTERAMCGHAGLDYPCGDTAENRRPIEVEAKLSVYLSNVAFFHSGINAVLNLIHLNLFNEFVYPEEDDPSHTSTENYKKILETGDNNLVGSNEFVHALRDEHFADIVGLIIDKHYADTFGRNGISGDPDEDGGVSAYFVVNRNARHHFTFTHEVAHLFDSDHDDAFCSRLRDPFPCFKTIGMNRQSDQCTCMFGLLGPPGILADTEIVPRVPIFAGSGLKYSGKAIAVPGQSSVEAMNEAAPLVANFRVADS